MPAETYMSRQKTHVQNNLCLQNTHEMTKAHMYKVTYAYRNIHEQTLHTPLVNDSTVGCEALLTLRRWHWPLRGLLLFTALSVSTQRMRQKRGQWKQRSRNQTLSAAFEIRACPSQVRIGMESRIWLELFRWRSEDFGLTKTMWTVNVLSAK